jgi:hypothetical protein
VNVTINNRVAFNETNASIGTLLDSTGKVRKDNTKEEGDMAGENTESAPKRRPVPGSSKLKITDVRNLSDDADQIIDTLKAIDYGV